MDYDRVTDFEGVFRLTRERLPELPRGWEWVGPYAQTLRGCATLGLRRTGDRGGRLERMAYTHEHRTAEALSSEIMRQVPELMAEAFADKGPRDGGSVMDDFGIQARRLASAHFFCLPDRELDDMASYVVESFGTTWRPERWEPERAWMPGAESCGTPEHVAVPGATLGADCSAHFGLPGVYHDKPCPYCEEG